LIVNETTGGFTGDPAATLTVAATSGCCGNPPTTTLDLPEAATDGLCCGTAAEATASGGCCGSAAKAEAIASGAGCCG
jgi:hypothetical protein